MKMFGNKSIRNASLLYCTKLKSVIHTVHLASLVTKTSKVIVCYDIIGIINKLLHNAIK